MCWKDISRVEAESKRIGTNARQLVLQVISNEFKIGPTYAEKWAGQYLKAKSPTN